MIPVAASLFDQNRTNPDDQAVFNNRPIYAGTIGPNASARKDPTSFKNSFVSKVKDQVKSTDFYQQAFSSGAAAQAQKRIDTFGSQPTFSDPSDVALGKDFAQKYATTMLVPEDQKINNATIDPFRSQQPGQGIGDTNVTASSKLNYPGQDGTSV